MIDKREVNFGRYRVLLIPSGQKKDAEGRELGDDWMLATLGCAEEGDGSYDCYVTTNRVRASEYDVPNALETAFILAEALSKQCEVHRYGEKCNCENDE